MKPQAPTTARERKPHQQAPAMEESFGFHHSSVGHHLSHVQQSLGNRGDADSIQAVKDLTNYKTVSSREILVVRERERVKYGCFCSL